jgi:uncharacterized membrane protein YdjX (TVP38/TMEM64 family)
MSQLKRLPLKYGLWSGLGLIILTGLWLNRARVLALLALLADRAALTAHLEAFGPWGPLLLVLILSLNVIFAIIPGHILLISGGYLYGFSYGLSLNLVGTVGASQLVFVLVQWAGRPLAQRLIPPAILSRWRQVAQRQGFIFFLLFFWFPIIPSNVMNFVAGLSPISFWAFLAANFLGRLPGIALVTLIGSHGLELSFEQWLVMALLGGTLFLAGRFATKRVERYFAKPELALEETDAQS